MRASIAIIVLSAALHECLAGQSGRTQGVAQHYGDEVPKLDALTSVSAPISRECPTCNITGPLNVCASDVATAFLDHTEWIWCAEYDDRRQLSVEGLKMQTPQLLWKYIDRRNGSEPMVWSKAMSDDLLAAAAARDDISPPFYPYAAIDHYDAFDQFSILNASLLVAGSVSPWLEAIAKANGAARIVTSEYSQQSISDYNLSTLVNVMSLREMGERFDAILSFSSIEHDGLGAYGDPINPNGDLCAMREFHKLLKSGGLLFLGVPVGRGSTNDLTVIRSNMHRIYGTHRLMQMFRGYDLLTVIDTHHGKMPWPKIDKFTKYEAVANQPIFVLRKVGTVME